MEKAFDFFDCTGPADLVARIVPMPYAAILEKSLSKLLAKVIDAVKGVVTYTLDWRKKDAN